jgi:hypothetical protein
MWQSCDRDVTDVAGAVIGHQFDVNKPRSVEWRDGFRVSFLFLQLFLIKFQLLPI